MLPQYGFFVRGQPFCSSFCSLYANEECALPPFVCCCGHCVCDVFVLRLRDYSCASQHESPWLAHFSVSQLKTKMVVDWLLHRVDDIIDHYFLACQRVCWVDSDVEEDDADAVHALHLHSASCASLYGDYSVMLLKAFTMDPDLLRPELWPLMLALEMVTDEEVQMREHADAFFLGHLGQDVRGVLRNVIAKLK